MLILQHKDVTFRALKK